MPLNVLIALYSAVFGLIWEVVPLLILPTIVLSSADCELSCVVFWVNDKDEVEVDESVAALVEELVDA